MDIPASHHPEARWAGEEPPVLAVARALANRPLSLYLILVGGAFYGLEWPTGAAALGAAIAVMVDRAAAGARGRVRRRAALVVFAVGLLVEAMTLPWYLDEVNSMQPGSAGALPRMSALPWPARLTIYADKQVPLRWLPPQRRLHARVDDARLVERLD